MSRFVLIHGAWHGAWCWDKVVPLLEAGGHTVRAIDLPGHGQDRTPTAEVPLAACAQRVCSALDESATPAILVGHSAGGLSITQAAEWRPDAIQALVYLTAGMPRNGESMRSLGSAAGALGLWTRPTYIEPIDGGIATRVQPEMLRPMFYPDCSDEDVARAEQLLVPEPAVTTTTPVQTTEENFGRVPRYYVRCSQDVVLTPGFQDFLIERLPCQGVFTLDTSHSPFFSAPEALSEALRAVLSAEKR